MVALPEFSLTRSAFTGSIASIFLSSHVSNEDFLGAVLPPNDDALFSLGDELQLESAATKIRSGVASFLDQEDYQTGPLIRLAFHDAATYELTRATASSSTTERTTGGPNGSIRYELDRSENRALTKPLEMVTSLWKEVVQDSSSISIADTIALSGSAAIYHAGGPEIKIRLGRQDVNAADPQHLRNPVRKSTERSVVDRTLPSAALDSDGLRLYFRRLGMSDSEFVALCGAHGVGRHVSLLNMSKSCLKNLTRSCLEDAPVLLPFVTSSVDKFDNSYFKFLLKWYERSVELGEVAFIPTDVALVVDTHLRKYVQRFALDQDYYFRTFTTAYQKLVDTTATTIKRY